MKLFYTAAIRVMSQTRLWWIFFAALLLCEVSAQTAPEKPEVTVASDKKEVKAGQEIELTFTADIPAGWYVYSNDFDPDLGPIQASFDYGNSTGIELTGGAKPVGNKKKYDEVWEGDVSIFSKHMEFRQTVKITGEKPEIKGSIEYQMCSESDGMCILYTNEFSLDQLSVVK